MYAVIKTGGKQFKVSEGLTLKVEKLTTEVGKQLSINNVLTLVDGEKVTGEEANISEAEHHCAK